MEGTDVVNFSIWRLFGLCALHFANLLELQPTSLQSQVSEHAKWMGAFGTKKMSEASVSNEGFGMTGFC